MSTDWTRSSFHQPTRLGDCVEVKQHGDGVVGVTDARRRELLSLLFSPESWAAFVAGVKAGEFDFGELPADGT